ncbi:MAG: glycosyltransferase WbuB [Firmicutes bacterium HGW-Firmicutes-5]|nr:MAG: glycosyltransferase WbuB [Firmicutes bacterium HGW-Firmicutes-5]
MKILVVCQYYYPEQFRINDICEQLVLDGHSVNVLTGLPNYPEGKIPKEYKWGKKRKETINGVQVIRSFEFGRGSNTVSLGLNYISYMISASVKMLFMKKDFDLVFAYQLSPVTMVLPAIIIKKIGKVPLYLYCCDIWPDSMKNIINNQDHIIYKVLKRFSTYIYSQSDEIGITSKPFFEYFQKVHSISIKKISYIPQHAEETYLSIDEPVDNGVIDFVFMGNIGIAQDIDCIIDAANIMHNDYHFKVHLVGDGSYLEKCKNKVKERQLSDYFIFHGRHPLDQMPKFYDIADACLLTLKGDSLVGLTMPSKLQGYMAAGRPVFGAINGAAQDIINESKCGVCVDASNSILLAEAMRDFIENPLRYQECGKYGRKYFVENFTKDIYMKKLINRFTRLLGETKYV